MRSKTLGAIEDHMFYKLGDTRLDLEIYRGETPYLRSSANWSCPHGPCTLRDS